MVVRPLQLAIFALAASASAAIAEDQAYLGVFAETHVMKIAGVKIPELPPLPPGVKLPANVLAMIPGAPSRMLNVRLWSPSIAPDNATASITPPSGLQVGDKLDLDLFRPSASGAPSGGGSTGEGSTGTPPDFTIKFYWGSSSTVQAGQPKIITLGSLTNGQKAVMAQRMSRAQKSGGSYFYKDGWTTGYWPGKGSPGSVPKEGTLPGTYDLKTSYTGNVTFDVPAGVDFLDPIDITSPDLATKPDLSQALNFQWKPIPNCLGTYASAIGMEGKNTLIIWSSSDSYNDQIIGDNGFLQMSEVKDRVQAHTFLSGDQNTVTVPAGIFSNADFAMLDMVGYGPGAAKDGVQPLPRVQTKTSLNLMLGGKIAAATATTVN